MNDEEKEFNSKYKTYRLLGEGSYGKVRYALCKNDGKAYAVKMYNIKEETIKQFQQEIESLKNLNHKNIVKIYEYFIFINNLVIVIEYCPEGDLFDYVIAHGKISESESREYFLQIVDGLRYSHSKGIIHRDLKLDNILLKNGNIKICDWGLSRQIAHLGGVTVYKTRTCCGSIHYSAPEILEHCEYGLEVDIFSLGVILYVMLTGCFPWSNDNTILLVQEVIDCNFIPPQNCTILVRNLLKHLIVKNPRDRISIDGILQHPWILCSKYDLSNLSPEKPINPFAIKLLEDQGYCGKEIVKAIENLDDKHILLYLDALEHIIIDERTKQLNILKKRAITQ